MLRNLSKVCGPGGRRVISRYFCGELARKEGAASPGVGDVLEYIRSSQALTHKGVLNAMRVLTANGVERQFFKNEGELFLKLSEGCSKVSFADTAEVLLFVRLAGRMGLLSHQDVFENTLIELNRLVLSDPDAEASRFLEPTHNTTLNNRRLFLDRRRRLATATGVDDLAALVAAAKEAVDVGPPLVFDAFSRYGMKPGYLAPREGELEEGAWPGLIEALGTLFDQVNSSDVLAEAKVQRGDVFRNFDLNLASALRSASPSVRVELFELCKQRLPGQFNNMFALDVLDLLLADDVSSLPLDQVVDAFVFAERRDYDSSSFILMAESIIRNRAVELRGCPPALAAVAHAISRLAPQSHSSLYRLGRVLDSALNDPTLREQMEPCLPSLLFSLKDHMLPQTWSRVSADPSLGFARGSFVLIQRLRYGLLDPKELAGLARHEEWNRPEVWLRRLDDTDFLLGLHLYAGYFEVAGPNPELERRVVGCLLEYVVPRQAAEPRLESPRLRAEMMVALCESFSRLASRPEMAAEFEAVEDCLVSAGKRIIRSLVASAPETPPLLGCLTFLWLGKLVSVSSDPPLAAHRTRLYHELLGHIEFMELSDLVGLSSLLLAANAPSDPLLLDFVEASLLKVVHLLTPELGVELIKNCRVHRPSGDFELAVLLEIADRCLDSDLEVVLEVRLLLAQLAEEKPQFAPLLAAREQAIAAALEEKNKGSFVDPEEKPLAVLIDEFPRIDQSLFAAAQLSQARASHQPGNVRLSIDTLSRVLGYVTRKEMEDRLEDLDRQFEAKAMKMFQN